MKTSKSKQKERILHASFNQDDSCVSVGTETGFFVFTVDPFRKCYQKTGQGVSIMQMLFSTSLLAIVAAGQANKRLQLFNSSESKIICELNFVASALNVLLSRRRLVVVLEHKIHVFDLSSMKILRTIETEKNKRGLCAISSMTPQTGLATAAAAGETFATSYLAYPFGSDVGDIVICDATTVNPVRVIKAHKGALSAIAFNNDGTMLASASTKGTVIRIFSVPNGDLLFALRRGSYNANIYSIRFNHDSTMVCVSSDKGTIHIFKLPSMEQVQKKNQIIGTISDALSNMLDSVRDFAHAKVQRTDVPNVCSFAPSGDALHVITYDGTLYRFSVDKVNGGECKLEYQKDMLDPSLDSEITEEEEPKQQQPSN